MSVLASIPTQNDRFWHLKVHTKEYKTHQIYKFNITNKNGSHKYTNVDTTSCDADTLLNQIH
jgi:hypothetical protein